MLGGYGFPKSESDSDNDNSYRYADEKESTWLLGFGWRFLEIQYRKYTYSADAYGKTEGGEEFKLDTELSISGLSVFLKIPIIF